jgi:tRNA-splicing ligase RtcB
MKQNEILAPWKGDKRFTAMAKRVGQLKKAKHTPAEIAAAIAAEFGPPPTMERLRDQPGPFSVYGAIGDDIERGAVEQLELAMRLPVAARGALLPDAHPGYALPIGGVFAAHNAVAPAMVGVDIGCRMHLTILDLPPDELRRGRDRLFDDLQSVTVFGAGGSRKRAADHEILEPANWEITSQTRTLRPKAAQQLGTSGSGNHFAELVVGERLGDNDLPKRFAGLLTHSGSRGVGYAIAQHYIRLAAQETARRAKIPKMYEWLDLDGEAGQEYWAAMELAGAYAEACHEVIHRQFLRRAGLKARLVIQNHHNFAWREGGLVVHRKGATPAGAGVRGVIPGSMAAASYIVEGRGSDESLNSASHGAGRLFSRAEARNTISMAEVRQFLKQKDIVVAGLSIDESPFAYKDIERVMQLQVEAGLVAPLARMWPVAVQMAGEKGDD